MRKYLFISLLFLYFNSFSQIKYEQGYLVNNTGEKINCLIRNVDWENNPKEFRYKLTETSDLRTGTISDIKEFGILNSSRYRRFTVRVDTSSSDISYLSKGPLPEFKEQDVFLKTLVGGKVSLYEFKEKGLQKIFL